jgi:prophage tail gpP-like protein
VEWDANRRRARSYAVNVTCDSWRDSARTLWDINTLAPVDLPALKLGKTWVIGQVTFTRDESGQHAHLVLMGQEAFSPEPMGDLQPQQVQTSDVEKFNATKPTEPTGP